jgi:high-affinity nickel-transport protein
LSLTAILTLGFFLGMRHATEADHVVAVSTIVGRQRTLRAAAPIGILWGLGHALTLLLVGGAIILFGVVIPPRIGLLMELSVGVMLLLLGALNLGWPLRRGAKASAQEAAHPHPHAHEATSSRPSPYPTSLRPLAIGVVHGLAGSAAVTLLVLGAIRAPSDAALYLLAFGAGTIAGMLVVTTAMATPLLLVPPHRFERLHRALGVVTGVASVVLGVGLVYDIGFVHGLFSAEPHWVPR